MPESLTDHIDYSNLLYTGNSLTIDTTTGFSTLYVKDCVKTLDQYLNIGDTDGDKLPDISGKYAPKRIIRNGPVTIVFWKDGTKTLVRLKEGMNDDPYVAFCSALAKKIFGNNSRVKKIVAETRTELPKEMKR